MHRQSLGTRPFPAGMNPAKTTRDRSPRCDPSFTFLYFRADTMDMLSGKAQCPSGAIDVFSISDYNGQPYGCSARRASCSSATVHRGGAGFVSRRHGEPWGGEGGGDVNDMHRQSLGTRPFPAVMYPRARTRCPSGAIGVFSPDHCGQPCGCSARRSSCLSATVNRGGRFGFQRHNSPWRIEGDSKHML
jgi:hypothetical protein